MEIIRYVNDVKITGKIPEIIIDNPGVLQVIRDLELRILQETSGRNPKRAP